MAGETLSPLLGFGAGVLTILSPCVLPLVPIVLSAAAQRHKYGPLVLAAGLVVSFTSVGFIIAAFGSSLGLDAEVVRAIGAVALVLAGAALLIPQAQTMLATAAGPLAGWANERQNALERFGLLGQAGIGALLGLIWSPCVGPTLGAATIVAAQGQQLGQVALVMASFGIGIASVLLVISLAGRKLFNQWRGRLLSTGSHGKHVLGGLLVIVGVGILTGVDRLIEGVVVSNSPAWLVDLTTSL